MENNKQILTITDAALNRVKLLMKKTGNDIVGLRVGIKTAGCSGLKYNIEYAKEVKQFEEKVFLLPNFTINGFVEPFGWFGIKS